jgi:mycofactocin precursor
MADLKALTNRNASPDLITPIEPDISNEADLEEELEELVIEDFTIDGICGVY